MSLSYSLPSFNKVPLSDVLIRQTIHSTFYPKRNPKQEVRIRKQCVKLIKSLICPVELELLTGNHISIYSNTDLDL